MSTTSMTTIKIGTGLRDRINGAARERGVSAGSFVEELFDRWLREQHFAAVRDALATAAPDHVASWELEQADWDGATVDDWPDAPTGRDGVAGPRP